MSDGTLKKGGVVGAGAGAVVGGLVGGGLALLGVISGPVGWGILFVAAAVGAVIGASTED